MLELIRALCTADSCVYKMGEVKSQNYDDKDISDISLKSDLVIFLVKFFFSKHSHNILKLVSLVSISGL